ncbi:MAG: hypothetical protein HGB00_08295 [Chlorobiaceae bacterium]|nr:hypothetical protein [Chlorobiaceae bacterium]
MDIEEAGLILEEVIEVYISKNPERAEDVFSAVQTIGKTSQEAAAIVESYRATLDRIGSLMLLQTVIMNSYARAYP